MEPKQKQHPVVDVTGDWSKVRCCKEQYCIGTWNVRSVNQGKLEVVKQEMARVNTNILLGEAHDWNRPPWPGTIVTICMSCFMTGDPDKEYWTNKPPPTGRVRERSKGDTACPSTSQNPSRYHPSWLSNACATRKDSELEWLAKDHPETNPITIKP